MSKIVDIAAALRTSLDAGRFGQKFEVVRSYTPLADLETLAGARCYVMPRDQSIVIASREDLEATLGVVVLLAVKLADNPADIDVAACDAWLEVGDEIVDHVFALGPLANCSWLGVSRTPLFDAEALRTTGVLAMPQVHTYSFLN